jgi:hypothetical protein
VAGVAEGDREALPEPDLLSVGRVFEERERPLDVLGREERDFRVRPPAALLPVPFFLEGRVLLVDAGRVQENDGQEVVRRRGGEDAADSRRARTGMSPEWST